MAPLYYGIPNVFFLFIEGVFILYDRLIHPKEFPKHIINTNKCPGCTTGKGTVGGGGGDTNETFKG